jgi:hypothetical protein
MKLLLLFFVLFVHIKYRDIPIRKYNVTHIGANIQPGGEKLGFTKVAYQLVNDEAVNIDPRTPINWQIVIEMTNFTLRFILQNKDGSAMKVYKIYLYKM